MTSKTKQIIENNSYLIENGNYDKLYNRISPYDRPDLTKTLLSADLDPSLYMEVIPCCYGQHLSTTKLILHSNIKVIGEDAFRGSTFQEVYIPKSCTRIDKWAFLLCSRLTEINYEGTEEDWKVIQKGWQWKSGTPKPTIHYNAKLEEK